MDPIRMVDLQVTDRPVEGEIGRAIQRVLDRKDFIGGEDVALFAAELESELNIPHIVPCGNGTDALQLCLMALNLPKGSEVITPAFSYAATVEVIVLLGLKPIYVDVDPATFNLDPALIETAITKKTSAIMPVHLYGQCADMEPIMATARKYDLKVIEDAAQAVGAGMTTSNGERLSCGGIGDMAGFSFFPSKNLGAYGDGGAIATKSPEFFKKVKQLANHGQSERYTHEVVGVNSRLDTLQAAVLRVKLTQLASQTARRQEIAMKYDEGLGGIDGLIIPVINPRSEHVYHQYTLRTKPEDREMLMNFLGKNGISSRVYYPTPLPLQPAYRTGDVSGRFPVAEELSKTVLSIPVHPGLSDEDVSRVIETIKDYYTKIK